MNELLRWHDGPFLHFLQESYFGWSALSGLIVCLLLIALPIHRRLAQIVIIVIILWVLATVSLYGAFREAPILACVTVFAAIFSGLRALAWRMRASNRSLSSTSWMRPDGRWTTGVMRDYFRVDPRGAYWLDVARASRGMPAQRSSAERQTALFPVFEIPTWRARLWRRAVFPLCELYIRWVPRLPRYWHYDHSDLDLGETDVQRVLNEEIAQQSRRMADAEAGQSFAEYLRRTVDAREHQHALERAGRHGRKACLLQEASIESRLFSGRFDEGDKRLCLIADSLIELWRFRRRNDSLWAEEFLREDNLPADAVGPNGEKSLADSKITELTESPSEDVADVLSPEVDEPEFQLEPEDDPQFELDTADEVFAVDEVLETSDASLEPNEGASTVALLAPPVAATSTSAATTAAVIPLTTRRETERIRDLRLACDVLEGYLDFEPSDDLDQTMRAARRLLDRPARWPAATRLMMLYCLRADWRTNREERVKAETVAWIFQWVRSLLGQDELVRSVKHLFFDLLIDWHACRGGYSQIRELFAQTEPRGSRQWELLGIAEAHIAAQVHDRPSLRDTLIRDAAAALFRAHVSGFWTQRYAGLLLGTADPTETIHLLQAHNVEFGRKELDRMVARSTAAKPVSPVVEEPAETVDVALEIEPANTEAPQWFNSRRARGDSAEATPQPRKPEPSSTRRASESTRPAVADDTRAALPELVLVDVKSGRRVQCKKYPVRFGSGEQSQIKHAKLEPEHCAITCVDGHPRLMPIAATAALKVNDAPVTRAVRLKKGDVLQIGPIRLQVEAL
ncbi:MAG TPA: FHA domain-containing protein [Planctomycetaceae bacterium]|nr:FHA domain-containing protein [Planctomycetaceae bacterium]